MRTIETKSVQWKQRMQSANVCDNILVVVNKCNTLYLRDRLIELGCFARWMCSDVGCISPKWWECCTFSIVQHYSRHRTIETTEKTVFLQWPKLQLNANWFWPSWKFVRRHEFANSTTFVRGMVFTLHWWLRLYSLSYLMCDWEQLKCHCRNWCLCIVEQRSQSINTTANSNSFRRRLRCYRCGALWLSDRS